MAASGSGTLTPDEAAGVGGSLLLDGHPFHAHEVFEDAWKAAVGPERDLWRGLAQVAVGLTHARRGNARGAAALLSRGAALLREYSGSACPHGIDVPFVATRAAGLASRIESAGLAALGPDDLRLALRPGQSSQ
jgi:hypothetical protein